MNVQASSRGFYSRGHQAYTSSPRGRYEPYDPSQDRRYDQYNYRDYPEEQRGPPDNRPEAEYNRQPPDNREDYRTDDGDWATGAYRSEGQQGPQMETGGVQGDQQLFDIYSRADDAFLPAYGESIEVPEQPNNSRIMDEVENFYNRPESVVEDVQKFYDDRGQRIEQPLEVGCRTKQCKWLEDIALFSCH